MRRTSTSARLRVLLWAVLFVASCSGGGGEAPIGGAPGSTTRDAAVADGSPGGPKDGGTPWLGDAGDPDLSVPTTCPCPLEYYCDLQSNQCKAGCLKDDHCDAGRYCDTAARACATGCRDAADCPGATACLSATCVNGVCGSSATNNGGACPDDGNSCTRDVCAAGACTHPPVAGTPSCGSDPDQCNARKCMSGACTTVPAHEGSACTPNGLCATATCAAGTCVSTSSPTGTECGTQTIDGTIHAQCGPGGCSDWPVCWPAGCNLPSHYCKKPTAGSVAIYESTGTGYAQIWTDENSCGCALYGNGSGGTIPGLRAWHTEVVGVSRSVYCRVCETRGSYFLCWN